MVKLKDIEGVVKKEHYVISKLRELKEDSKQVGNFEISQKSICLILEQYDQQGSVSIGLNRERLAELLFNNSRKFLVYLSPKSENVLMKNGKKLIPTWEESEKSHKNSFRQQADCIIANLKDLLEVQHD